MKIITVTLAPNQAVLTCYLQDQSPKMPNAAIRPAMLVVPGGGYQYCSDREGEPVAWLIWHRGSMRLFCAIRQMQPPRLTKRYRMVPPQWITCAQRRGAGN